MAESKLSTIWRLWKQFLPLSVSDVTMACGDPMITTTLAHLPQATDNIGAMGVAKAIVVFFESPIIMLLHASNTLATSVNSRKALWRFMLISCVSLTALLALLAIPTVFTFIAIDTMGVPQTIAGPAREAIFFLLLWPAAIGWRRYYQGLLISYGHANAVAHAGVLRLIVVAAILGSGFLLGTSGIRLAGFALIMGVISEAVAVTVASKKTGANRLPSTVSDPRLPDTLPKVWRFYWPLANSMLVVWGGRALLVGIVARSIDAPIALAAWPAAWGLTLVVANGTRMVQQVIIKNRGNISDQILLLFAASVGLSFSLLLFAVAATLVGQDIISSFVGNNATLTLSLLPVIRLCAIVPLIIACQNAIQGFLIFEAKTALVNLATWIGTGVLLLVAMVTTKANVPGATAAAIAMVSALLAETGCLAFGVWNPLTSRVAPSLATNISKHH